MCEHAIPALLILQSLRCERLCWFVQPLLFPPDMCCVQSSTHSKCHHWYFFMSCFIASLCLQSILTVNIKLSLTLSSMYSFLFWKHQKMISAFVGSDSYAHFNALYSCCYMFNIFIELNMELEKKWMNVVKSMSALLSCKWWWVVDAMSPRD